MKRSFYLQHPLMAMHDSRMKNLLEKEGMKGIGAYWIIMEKLSLLPEPCADPEYLQPFCNRKMSFGYLMKIILDYGLFSIDNEEHFTPLELNPPRKKENETAISAQKLNENKPKTNETAPLSVKNRTKSDNTEIDYALNNNDLQQNTVTFKENIKDIITSSSSSEREKETDDDDDLSIESSTANQRTPVPAAPPKTTLTVCDDYGQPQKPLHPVRPWQELLDELALNNSWVETACMKSGYSELLVNHFAEAVQMFKQHILLYQKGEELTSMKEVCRYFVNFTKSGNRTSKTLREALLALEAKQHPDAPDPYRYEQRIDGKRTYMGCPIPNNAPPRPDATAIWDEVFHLWMTEKKPKPRSN